MGRLIARVRPRREVRDDEVAAMYRLYAAYYDAVSHARFAADLAGKDYVIELVDGPALRGFSTLALIDYASSAGPSSALFSGDTIIDRDYWGEQALSQAFCRFAGAVKAQRPRTPLFWFLITKGYRTYRYLAVFAREYFPNPHRATPAHIQAAIDQLAHMRFGAAYCAQRGLIRFAESRGHLKPQWAAIRESVRDRAEVRFFLERNPGYHMGEELCCVALLEADNLRSYARKAFLEGLQDERATCIVPEHGRGIEALSPLAFAGPDRPRAQAPEPTRA